MDTTSEATPVVDSTENSTPVESGEQVITSESSEEFRDELETAIDEGASDAEIKKMIREYELKVNGKTIKASLDLSDDEEIKKYLQKAHAFNEKAQEASKFKKDYEELDGKHKFTTDKFESVLQQWKKAPSAMFEALGIDKLAFIEQQVEEYLREQEMDPKEKEIRLERQKREELEKRLQSIEDEKRKAKEELDKKNQEESEKQAMNDISNSILSGIETSDILKHLQSDGIISKEDLFNEAVDLMYRNSSEDDIATFETIAPLLEKKYKAVHELSKNRVKKSNVPPVKKVVPLAPNDVKSVSDSVLSKEKSAPAVKKSFSEVMKRR